VRQPLSTCASVPPLPACGGASTSRRSSACEREDAAFSRCDPTARLASPWRPTHAHLDFAAGQCIFHTCTGPAMHAHPAQAQRRYRACGQSMQAFVHVHAARCRAAPQAHATAELVMAQRAGARRASSSSASAWSALAATGASSPLDARAKGSHAAAPASGAAPRSRSKQRPW